MGDELGRRRAGGRGLSLGQDKGTEEDAFGLAGGLDSDGGGADAFDLGGGGLADLLAEDGGLDAELLGGVGGELVAVEGVGHAADVGQEEVHGLELGLRGAGGEELAGAVDEVVGVALGAAEGGHVGLHAALADEAVGVEAALEGDDLDLEALFGEQGDGLFGGVGAGEVGVEVDDDAVGEAGEEADLVLGEGGAGGGEDVADAGHVDGDAVHLAFDEEGEVVRAHVGLGLVEVEEDVALGEERRFGGVEVLGDGAALVVDVVEGAGGEGDGFAGLVRDGEGDAFAEAGVHLSLRAVFAFFGARRGLDARMAVFLEVGAEGVAHVVEVVGGVADAEGFDGLGGDAAAGEVFAGAGGLGRLQGLLEVLGGGLVNVDELAANAGFAGLFGGGELAFGQGDAGLGGDDADGLGEGDVFELHDEGEDVAFFVAAEAVEVAVGGVDGEGAGLLFVEGAEAGVVLGAGLS